MWKQLQVQQTLIQVGNYDYFLGQPEKLEPAAATDEEEQFLTVASIDLKSGWKVGSYFIVGNYNDWSGQSGSGNKIQFKSKLSKASQEAVLHRHLLLENKKKKKNNATKKEDQLLTVTETSVETNSGPTKII